MILNNRSAYSIMLGQTQQDLLADLVLPTATISFAPYVITKTGTSGDDVFDPGRNSGGTFTMIGGGGNDVFYVHGGNNIVVAQAGGINTVISDIGWGVYTLPANVQNLIYNGTASFANNYVTLQGNELDNTIVAGNQGVALVAGLGNDTLVGGTGADVFVVDAVGGNVRILNYHGGTTASTDTVQLRNLGFSTFAYVQAAMTQVGSDTVLNLGANRTLTFVNQQIAGFTAAQFGLPVGVAVPPPPLVAVAPTLAVGSAAGQAGLPIALSITPALVHPDPGETLIVKITGVPSGATLNSGTRNNDGSWALTLAQLSGLTLTPSIGSTGTITLTVTATAIETNGSAASVTLALPVTVGSPYAISIGSTQQNLLAALVLPTATVNFAPYVIIKTGTASNDVFEPGRNSGGTFTMIGGGGNDVFYVHGGNNVVVAQAGGINTVISDIGWGVYTLPANVKNLIYTGTASFATSYVTLQGNALDNTIVGGNQGVALVAGLGNDTLVGGAGADVFIVDAVGGNARILNFHGGTTATTDTVQLRNLGFTTFASVQAAMTQVGSDTVLNLGANRTLTFVNQQISNFTAAEFGLSAPAGSGGGTVTPPATGGGGQIFGPTIAQPASAGQVAGVLLRNNASTAITAHEVNFGQTFTQGQVPAGSQLFATIGGQTVAVQMDVKTTNADGSAKFAVLTLLQPALAAKASAAVMLSLAATPTTSAPIDLKTLGAAYNVVANLTLHNADGTTTAKSLNAGTLLQNALAANIFKYIRHGSQVTEVQFSVPVSGSLRVVFDVSRFADGSTSTNLSFNNDIALSASGGTVAYDATIYQNGTVVTQKTNLTQYQYTTWNQQIDSNASPAAQVVIDAAAFERSGALPNYDLTVGVSAATIAQEATQMTGSTYGTLGSASVVQYMPQTGGRPDIGPQPEWNAVWLMTQDPTATAYALGQAAAAGSVPWHFFDAQAGTYVSVIKNPTLWTDPRAATTSGYTPLTQQVSAATGWSTDAAHQPDLSYQAYILTGNQTYLDQLNAQASWAEASAWTVYRQNGLGLVANGLDQVRTEAWSLRQIDEAAYANPNGSVEKAYFTQLSNNNWHWLVSQIPTWTLAQGEAHGYVPGTYGGNSVAPWEQDYFVSTAVQAAQQGNADALTFLKWEANFIVGRFLNAAKGFNPRDGVAYNVTTSDASGKPLLTWAGIEQATVAAGQSNGTGWTWSDGDYGQLGLQSLAGIISVTQSADAIEAYGWLRASGAPHLDASAGLQFDIVPRLSDGKLLTNDHVILSHDTVATTFTAGIDDTLIHAGAGNDTLNGGSGINLLFGGSGNNVLNGGANNDYLFGGTGKDVFYGHAGINYMKAGVGADQFGLTATDIATDTIVNFKLGTDHLVIAGQAPGSAFVSQVLQGVSQDAQGSAVLHLSASHTVTLQGIGMTKVSASLFA